MGGSRAAFIVDCIRDLGGDCSRHELFDYINGGKVDKHGMTVRQLGGTLYKMKTVEKNGDDLRLIE